MISHKEILPAGLTFLSSSPATVRSTRKGAVKEASAGVVRPAGASRGHGPARLDWPLKRATVADKVMKSGKMAYRQRPVLCENRRKRSAQARIKESGRRRQRWKPAGAKLAPARFDAAARQRDRPDMAGDAQGLKFGKGTFLQPLCGVQKLLTDNAQRYIARTIFPIRHLFCSAPSATAPVGWPVATVLPTLHAAAR